LKEKELLESHRALENLQLVLEHFEANAAKKLAAKVAELQSVHKAGVDPQRADSLPPRTAPEQEIVLAGNATKLCSDLDAQLKKAEQQINILNLKNVELRNFLQESLSQNNPEYTIDKRIVTAMILNFLRVTRGRDPSAENDLLDVMAQLFGLE